MSNLKNIVTAEEFFRKKIRENHQIPKDFSLRKIDWLNGEETMRWAHEYAKLYAEEVIKEINSVIEKKIIINQKKSIEEKGELKKSYEDSVTTLVLLKMSLNKTINP